MREQVLELITLAPEFHPSGEPSSGTAADSSRWARWWDEISRYIRIDFNADKNIQPLLAGQSLSQVRLALSLALEQAQWAALNGEAAVYAQALTEARDVLKGNFSQDNPQSKLMLERLVELGKQPVAVVTPDLTSTLNSVQAYLERRNLRVDDSLKPATKPATHNAQETSP